MLARRVVTVTLAVSATLGALLLSSWGCTDLANDCELNLNCAGMSEPACTDLYAPGDCATCMEGYCCAALAGCNNDMNCLYTCLEGLWPLDPSCSTAPSAGYFQAVVSCQKEYCASACAAEDQCNPVSGSGCETQETCDAVYPGVFQCAETVPPLATLCGACNVYDGELCGGGLHCQTSSGKCAKYCCDDSDCGTGTCVTDGAAAFGQALPDTKEKVGLCLTDGGVPACDAPANPASGGSCAPTFVLQ